MVRGVFKGVAKVPRKLADGTKVVYHYAWRGGPLLKNKDGTPAQPHQVSFATEYARHHAQRDAQSNETVATLIEEFLKSTDYLTKSDATRKEYARYLEQLPDKFKHMKISMVEDPKMRGHFKKWRDSLSAKPRAADYAMAAIARVLSVARDNGRIKVNILEKPGRLHTPDRAEIIWTDKLVDKFTNNAPVFLVLPFLIALHTGQRRGDVLKLAWSAYDGDFVKVRQGKTGAYVRIPVTGTLKAIMDNATRTTTTVCANSRGRSWTPSGFDSSFGKERTRLGITGVTFNDLRGTAVTKLAAAGCTIPEIASYTGHSLDDINQLLDAHYLGGRAALAESASKKVIEYDKLKSKGE